MTVGALWLIFAIFVSVAAKARGRGAIGWFFISVIISPFISIVLLVALPNLSNLYAPRLRREDDVLYFIEKQKKSRGTWAKNAICGIAVIAAIFVALYTSGNIRISSTP